MKRVSDETLTRRIDGAKARIKENPLWAADYENLDLAMFEELQAWRSAFKGVEMVVPVEWRESRNHPSIYWLGTESGGLVGCIKRDMPKEEKRHGVIRLDEIFGTEGTK